MLSENAPKSSDDRLSLANNKRVLKLIGNYVAMIIDVLHEELIHSYEAIVSSEV